MVSEGWLIETTCTIWLAFQISKYAIKLTRHPTVQQCWATHCVVHRIYAGAPESVARGMFRSINCMYLLCSSIGLFSLVKQEIPMVIPQRLQQIITTKLDLVQCFRYKILPSGLCAEICCNRGKKRTFRKNPDFFGTYSRADRDLLSLFAPKCRIA